MSRIIYWVFLEFTDFQVLYYITQCQLFNIFRQCSYNSISLIIGVSISNAFSNTDLPVVTCEHIFTPLCILNKGFFSYKFYGRLFALIESCCYCNSQPKCQSVMIQILRHDEFYPVVQNASHQSCPCPMSLHVRLAALNS